MVGPSGLGSHGLPAGAVETIEALRAVRRERRLAEAKEFELAAHFADLAAELPASVVPGCERLRQLGSDGTPLVAEFCSLELAAALGMRDVEAAALVASALDVRHRLPWVWARTVSGELPVWQARRLASLVRELDLDGARLLDRDLSRSLPGMAWSRVERMVEGLVLAHLAPERAEQRRQEAMDSRGVWIAQEDDGVAGVQARIDAPQAAHLEQSVDWLARILAEGGCTGGADALRARALGVLASPARALQLMQASLLDQLPEEPEALSQFCAHEGEPGHLCGTVTVDPELLQPRAQLVVHLTDECLAGGTGPARAVLGSSPATRIRPLLTEWLSDLLADARVLVRPVLDPDGQVPSDSYECPRTMREALEIRNPYEVFPFSTRRSAGLDLDHTQPWRDDGPPGQTRPDNLGPLGRGVHRAKTHGGWQLTQPMPGIFLWRSPLGYLYLVTPSRTIELGRPGRACPTTTHPPPVLAA
ncbi:hypothetical protein GCM10009599_29720 [Luteococcus peritonei]